MKKTNTKKNSAMKKLLPAFGMLMVSASMLATSTYAWFTMNKTVEVTGMQMKAQAEKGLLINEMTGTGDVSGTNNGTYSESAKAGDASATALRPASTANLSAWWHANSKKSSLEAGVNAAGDGMDADTVKVNTNDYYTDIKPASLTPNTTAATADTNCERTVYYADGVGGTANYDDGEGYYIKYTYYLKSSSNATMEVSASKLLAKVTATLQGGEGATVQDLDPALRVGIQVDGDTKTTIYAPVANYDSEYYVTNAATGAASTKVEPVAGGTDAAINTAAVTLPAVNSTTGKAVYVYVWYEGEDSHCKSDNIAATLNSYEIKVEFTDDEL